MDFITSDLHFGHYNAIRHSNRPFTTVDEMDAGIIKLFNSTVGPDDTTYILGDFAYRNKEHVTYYLDQLNGKKFFVFGNHDHHTKSDIKRHPSVVGWADYYETKRDGVAIVMMHYPIAEWNGAYHGSVMLHGHCHGQKQFPGRIIDIGYDMHKRILPLHEAVAMAKARADNYETSWREYEANPNETIWKI